MARRGLRPSTVVPSETSARTGARPRGAGRPSVNGASRRSNARSGDSGDPDEPEPPGSAGRRLCGCGCRESIEHLAPQARYVNDTHRKRGARAQEWAEEYTTAPPSALVVDVGAATPLRVAGGPGRLDDPPAAGGSQGVRVRSLQPRTRVGLVVVADTAPAWVRPAEPAGHSVGTTTPGGGHPMTGRRDNVVPLRTPTEADQLEELACKPLQPRRAVLGQVAQRLRAVEELQRGEGPREGEQLTFGEEVA